jgi:predicted dehydrogenase
MRIVIIGTGGIAQKAYFPLIKVMPSVEVVGIHSRTQKNVDNALARWRFPFGTTDLNALLELKPDAAVVISATASHFDICRMMLENGVDVYAEKSLTTESKLSHDLHRIADENERILAVGFNRRYALLCEQAKEILGGRKVELAIVQKHRTDAFARMRTRLDQARGLMIAETPQRDDVDPARIGLFGQSLGGAIGLNVMAERDEIRAAVIVSAFTSWREIAAESLGGGKPGWVSRSCSCRR